MDPNSNTATVLAVARQGLQYGAGILAARGVMTESDSTLAISALMGLATLGWSIYSRRQLAKAPAVKS